MTYQDATGRVIEVDAIDLAFELIRAAPAWIDPAEQRGFFFGLTEGWTQAGIINCQQRAYLQDQLETALGNRAYAVVELPSRPVTFWRRILRLSGRGDAASGAAGGPTVFPSYGSRAASQLPAGPLRPFPSNTP